MKEWLRERPWIWIVVFMTVVVLSSIWMIIIAGTNRPTVIG